VKKAAALVYFQTASDRLDPALRQHRTAETTLTLTHAGAPLANQEVMVQQTTHKFLFGTNWGNTVGFANGELTGAERESAALYEQRFIELFNLVTLPFYWGRFEPTPGNLQTERIMQTARWYRERNCAVKGHPLCWHTVTADWLLKLSDPDILAAQLARIRREVTAFADAIDLWDVINEAVIMPIFDRYDNGITRICKAYGRIPLIRSVFAAARESNPGATLILNDFDTSPAYDILIEGCLEAGIKIDAIGIQSHMHQGYWGIEKTQSILERFARYKLPIHFTETTLVSGALMPPEIIDLNDYQVTSWPSTSEGEARQAEEAIQYYKSLFAHPAVQAITWWNLTDGGWLNAPAGLLRHDQSPKPAYAALRNLIKGEWWLSPTRMTTDSDGQISFAGTLGQYELSWADQRQLFALNSAESTQVAIKF
jgi:GH35 family endo-1,4-beta-xylanase